jgi:hypothetical protein
MKLHILICLLLINGMYIFANDIDIKNCGDLNNFKSNPYLDVATYLQSIPESKAVNLLQSWANSARYDIQVIVLCRMLFEPIKNDIFRRPDLGAPLFVGRNSIEMNPSSSIFLKFNLVPICIIEGTPFCVVKGYERVGLPPETASQYLTYCLSKTHWNTFKYQRLSQSKLENAYNNLLTTYFIECSLSAYDLKFLRKQVNNEESQ